MWNELKKRLDSPDSYVSLVLGLAVVLVIGMLIVNYIKTKSPQQAGTTVEKQAEAQQNAPQVPANLPATHMVREGETLWSIAENYYKSGYNWVDIKNANQLANENIIYVGQVLTVPKADPIVPAGNISAAATERDINKKSYTVVAGDNLWNIAVSQYGSGFRWVDIARANNLANPDLIYPGNVFSLP